MQQKHPGSLNLSFFLEYIFFEGSFEGSYTWRNTLIHTMDQLANLHRQLAEVRATQARLAEMEKELKTLIAAATAAADAPDPDTIVVNASTPTVPKPASDDEEYVPWTVDPAVLTKKLTPSPYVCSYPSSMNAYDLFWLRRDKPVVNKFDIMNHFLSGSGRDYVEVPEQMSYILDFIQEDLVHTSYDATITYHLGDAQAKAQEMLDKYNTLNSMEDVVRYKYDLVQKRRARSPYASPLPKGIEYRMQCARQKRSSAAATSSPRRASINPHPPSLRQKNYLRSLLVQVYRTAAPNQALPTACREFDIEPPAMTLNDLTGGRDGTASMLIAKLLARKRGVRYTPPAPTPSPAAQWVAKNGAIEISDDDSDDDLVNPSASSSRKEAMERLRNARGDSSKAKPRTKSRLKARAESSSDDDDDVLSGAAARGKKRRRKLSALYLLQQLPNIRF